MAGNIENELSQLKEQIKLLERMVYLKNNVSSSEEYITKYMETQSKLSSIMKNYNMDSYNHEKKLVELLKQKADIEEKRAKSAKERVNAEKESIKLEQETIKNKEKVQEQNKEIKKQEEEITDEQEKRNKLADERIRKALLTGKDKKEDDLNERRRQFAINNPNLSGKELKDALVKNKLADNETSKLLKDSLKSLKVGNRNVGELFSQGGSEISAGASLLNVGIQTFNKAVQVFSNAVQEGFKKQTGSYETNYTNIAVRTGMSKTTYRNNQMALGGFGKNILHEQGLMNNIRTSDVQDMWNSLANKGLSQEDILASSLESVITKTIVPYLDVTTDEMQQFNMSVGDNGLLKQIRGISKISQEEFGSTMITQKYMQEALEYMSPMADAANLDLLKNTVGGVEMLQYLQSEEGGNLSTSAIAKLYKRTTNLQEDLMGSLSSGDLTTQLSAVGILANGINQYEDMAGVQNQSFIAQDFIKKITPSDANLAAMFSSATGTNGTLNWEILKKNPDLLGAYSKGMGAAGGLDAASQEVTNSLANDEFHTTKQLTEILAENLTNEVSAFAEMLGPWFEVLTTAVSGIATLLGAKLLGKIGGKIFGNGGSAGGAGFFSNFANGTAGTVGGTLGNGLMNIGLASGYSGGSVGAAQAIGAIPAVASVAGIAGGGYMMYDGVKKFTADDATAMDKGVATAEVLGGTAGVAGGVIVGSGVVAGLAGAGAANAWNPVGWGLLIAAGFTALGVAIYDGVKEQEKANKALEQTTENQIAAGKESKKEWEQLNQIYQNEYESRQNNLDEIELELDRGKDLESVKNQLIQTGLLSQEDVNGLRDKDADALKELITAYKGETARLSNEMQDFTDIAGDEDAKVEGSAKIGAVNWLKSHYKEGATDDNLAIIKSMVETAQNTAEGDRSDVQKELIKWYDWAMGDDTIQDYDVKQLFEGFTKIDLNKESSVNELKQQLTKKQIKKFSDGNTFGDKISEITNYNKKISDQAVNAQFATLYEKVISGATREEIVEGLNNIGYGPDTSVNAYKTMISKIRDYAKDHGMAEINWESGKGYFRTGTDSIPYDNYPAMLHEGEAVLTASTANELRGLIDEYRATKEDNIKLEKAIQDQTEALATRLDAIYNKIGNPDSDTSIMPRKFRQWKSNGR